MLIVSLGIDLIIIIVSMPQGNVDNIVQAKEEINSSDRLELYWQIEEAFFGREGSFPIAPLYTPIRYFAITDWFELIRDSNFIGPDFSRFSVDMEAKEAARGE